MTESTSMKIHGYRKLILYHKSSKSDLSFSRKNWTTAVLTLAGLTHKSHKEPTYPA